MLVSEILSLAFYTLLIAIVLFDIKYLRIPEQLILGLVILVGLRILLDIAVHPGILFTSALLMFGILYIIELKVGGLGHGDVMLVTLYALYSGFFHAVTACAGGAITGIAFLLLSGPRSKSYERVIPFSPFLALGVLQGDFLWGRRWI